MNLDVMLCDHVQSGGDEKLYLSGAGATAFFTAAGSVPYRVRFGLAGTVTLQVPEASRIHGIAVRVLDETGESLPLFRGGRDEPIATIRSQLTVDLPEGVPADARHVSPFALQLEVQVPDAGVYEVAVSLDEEPARLLSFMTGLVPAP